MSIYAEPRAPILVRNHVDGPYVIVNHQNRWLSLRERVALFFGRLPIELRP